MVLQSEQTYKIYCHVKSDFLELVKEKHIFSLAAPILPQCRIVVISRMFEALPRLTVISGLG